MKFYDKSLKDYSTLDRFLICESKKEFRNMLSEIPDSLKEEVSNQKSMKENQEILTKYWEKYKDHLHKKSQAIHEVAKNLTAGELFEEVFDEWVGNVEFVKKNDGLHIISKIQRSWVEELILVGADFKEKNIEFEWFELEKNAKGFRLEFLSYDHLIEIEFYNAILNIEPINAFDAVVGLGNGKEMPWHYLCSVAENIYGHFHKNIASSKEQEHYDLIKYLGRDIYDPQKVNNYPREFIDYIHKHGFDEILDFKKNILKKLSLLKYEPLWRDIYHLFLETQRDYSHMLNFIGCQEEWNQEKEYITQKMYAQGFEGEYPFFRKKTFRRKVFHKSYGKFYFVKNQPLEHFVMCQRYSVDGLIELRFLCGTFLGKHDENVDVFSCLFDYKGYTHMSQIDMIDCIDEFSEDEFDKTIKIAIKSAQMLPLSKKEKMYEATLLDTSGFIAFIFSMGVFGSFLMTLGFVVMTFLLAGMFSSWHWAKIVVCEISWLKFFLCLCIGSICVGLIIFLVLCIIEKFSNLQKS